MKNKVSSKIISIHFGHNATVALLQDGKITDCVSEERLNRVKNSTGFPTLALEHIHKKINGIADYYVLTQKYPWGYAGLKAQNFRQLPYSSNPTVPHTPWQTRFFPSIFYKRVRESMLNCVLDISKNTKLKEEMETYFSSLLNVPKEKILYADHHLTHALSCRFFEANAKPKLIFTLDGEGDGLCATVSIKGKEDSPLSTVNKAFSIGWLYREVTAYLGMKPDEHEFKVMGLAPYAKQEQVDKLLPVFKKILWLNKKGEFQSDIPMPLIRDYLQKTLAYKRFDTIAGTLQKFTEEIVTEWILYWINKTGTRDISVSGGVFMNVKLNQRIMEMSDVDSLCITPSAGDESTVLGGCVYGYQRFCQENRQDCLLEPMSDLYLGTKYDSKEIESFIERNFPQNLIVEKPQDMEKTVAELLAHNEVVARFSGRMEFGARALGNRSILANPKNFENVRIINEMIKNRDFWMPFAASIMEEESEKYIKNPKSIDARFMAITFNTTAEAQTDLLAGTHPYDKTSRPQIVSQKSNPEYHRIIEEYRKITGVGGILNTSFNLHGEPNVESPEDALRTLINSGLKYLALGPYLISKK